MKKIIIIVAIAVAVALAATGITLAIVLNSDYLDSLKKYDVASDMSFNGVEILERDGLYYLTRDGKKLSETGYSFLESVNEQYFDDRSDAATLSTYEDLELFDWYVARKPDAETYFLVSSEGEEIVIAGETLEYDGANMPYVIFNDTVTNKRGVISLKAFDSGLSQVSDNEIAVNMYSEITYARVNDGYAMADYIVVSDKGDGSADGKYIYLDTNGKKLFEAIDGVATEYNVYDKENDKYIRYFATKLGEVYNLKGELVASDAKYTELSENQEYLAVSCYPEDEALTEEQNAENAYFTVISAKTTFKITAKEYNLEGTRLWGNLLYLGIKNADVNAKQEYKLFNLITGSNVICRYGATYVGNGLVRINANEEGTLFDYVDAETGATLMQTKYSDMSYYDGTNALWSATEFTELNAGLEDATKANTYLHFVATGKTTANLTIAWNESINVIVSEKEALSYVITSTNTVEAEDPTLSYNFSKKSIYVPFGVGKVGAYDKYQYLDVFADGIGVILATDFDSGKFDFIDAASGKIIKTVAAAGADMAKTTFDYEETYAIRQNNFDEESAVEFAIIKIMKNNDSNELTNTEWFVLSRNVVMKDDSKRATNALSATDIGSNIISVRVEENHLVVNTTHRASTLYGISEAYALEEIVSLDYKIADVAYYGYDTSEFYIVVYDEHENYGLYKADATQILAPVYDEINVCDEEYVIVEDKGGYGAIKINTKNYKTKQIIDCIYNYVYYFGDGGFLVVEYDSFYLFDEGKKVKSDRLVSPGEMYDYYIDEESGKLMCAWNSLVNYGGKWYIHRGEAEEIVTDVYWNYEDFQGDDYHSYGGSYNIKSGDITIDQAGVKAINFRDIDGKLIETKILYPTAKANVEFIMTEAWYTSPVKKLQKVAITELEVENMAGNQVINLYKAHPVAAGLLGQ